MFSWTPITALTRSMVMSCCLSLTPEASASALPMAATAGGQRGFCAHRETIKRQSLDQSQGGQRHQHVHWRAPNSTGRAGATGRSHPSAWIHADRKDEARDRHLEQNQQCGGHRMSTTAMASKPWGRVVTT
jgi:hypothetical protein